MIHQLIIILGITCFIAQLIILYVLIRNQKVKNFRSKLIKMAYNWSNDHIRDIVNGNEKLAFEWFYDNLPSYNKMTLSIKPLKLEYWATEDQINKIKSNHEHRNNTTVKNNKS